MEKRKENMILLQQQHEPGTNADAIAKKENSRADPSHMGGSLVLIFIVSITGKKSEGIIRLHTSLTVSQTN